jgi:alpha-tubulin suppressor-like RCC1 family protein
MELDLGKYRMTPKGLYVDIVAYEYLDVVSRNNKMYVVGHKDGTIAGEKPEVETTKWLELLDGAGTMVYDSNVVLYTDDDGNIKTLKITDNGYLTIIDRELVLTPLNGDFNKEESVALLSDTEYGSPMVNGTAFMTTKNRLFVSGDNHLYTYKNGNAVSGWVEKVFIDEPTSPIKKLITTHCSIWAISEDNKCYRLGYNAVGNLGTNDNINVFDGMKELVIDGEEIVDVTVNGTFTTNQTTYILTASGKVYASGYGAAYKLGNNNTANINTFEVIFDKTADTIKAIKLAKPTNNSYGGMGIITDEDIDNLYVFGRNGNGSLGVGNTANVKTPTKVILGARVTEMTQYSYDSSTESTIIIADDKALFAGDNQSYLAGDSTNTTSNVFKDNSSGLTNFVSNVGMTSYKYGQRWSITESGDVYASGYNATGSLGVNSTAVQTSLIKCLGDFEGKVKKVLTSGLYGDSATFLLTTDGDVYRAGSTTNYKAGTFDSINTKVFEKIKTLKNVEDISISYNCVLFKTSTRELYVIGQNNYGQTSLDKTTAGIHVPTKIFG